MKPLREEREQLQVSRFEVKHRYETELMCVREPAGALQHELNKQIPLKVILLKYHEELQATFKRSQRTSTAELQVETEQKKLLQE